MLNVDILVRQIENSARITFVHPYSPEYHRACQALQIRGLLLWGDNPIKVPGNTYSAWYADIDGFDAATYAKFSMIVRDFYAAEVRAKFDRLFVGVEVDKIPRSIANPNNYMRAQQKVVDALIEKWKDRAPLEFYGSKHPAEGVALFLKSLEAWDKSGAINNDSQGMAKTRQAIIAAIEAGFKKILVVAPKTARVTTWPTEIAKIEAPDYTLISKKSFRTKAKYDLLQWDELRRMPQEFFVECGKYELVIADEFHRASVQTSQRSQALEMTITRIPKIWGLTGTAVRKRPRNLINLLRLIKHPLVTGEGKERWFLDRYCANKFTDPGTGQEVTMNYDGAHNLDELHELLRDCLIRREKSQTNLPPKIRYVRKIFFSPEEQKAYQEAFTKYKAEHPAARLKMALHKERYPWGIVKKNTSLREAALLKMPAVQEWAEELMDDGEKAIIFTNVTEVWERHMAHFKDVAVGIHGGTSDAKRTEAVHRFQNDPKAMVFCGNILAAGESLTLTASSNLAFNDITYVPTEMLQAEDRHHRGGAVKTCNVTYFVAAGTKDEDHFIDFVHSKSIVDSIVTRRDPSGNIIRDAVWAGDLEGLVDVEA